MKKEIRGSKGITLIALVITIIVLLILAGVAISMVTGDNGILNQATKAKDEHNKAAIVENVKLAVMESMTDADHKVKLEVLNPLLKEEGYIGEGEEIAKLPATIVIDEEHIVISEEGNVAATDWYYKTEDKKVITNGQVNLEIGTYVTYNHKASDLAGTKTIQKPYESPAGTYVADSYAKASDYTMERGTGHSEVQKYVNTDYTGEWRVLGIDESTGELQLISSDVVKTTDKKGLYLRGFTGYQYGVQELNNISEIFRYGYGATGARSVTIDDINKLTGYNPYNIGVYDPEQNGTGKKYGGGSLTEYDNKVTYSWTGDSIYLLGQNNERGATTKDYSTYGFNYYTNGKWYTSLKSSTATSTNKEKITELTNSKYMYYAKTLTSNANDTVLSNAITEDSVEWSIVMNAGDQYFIANNTVTASTNPRFGIRIAASKNYRITSYDLYQTDGKIDQTSQKVRPVVNLKSDIQLDDTNSDGKYEIIK